MKIIIDINKKYIKTVQYRNPLSLSAINEVEKAISVGMPIPDNATNGDVIKAMFPKIDDNFSNVIDLKLWWNAPFQKECITQTESENNNE